MVAHAATLGAEISLHTGPPGPTGANEIETKRQLTDWGPPRINDGVGQSIGDECTFEVPGGVTCTHFGVWRGEEFQYGAPIDPSITVGFDGGIVVLAPAYQEVPG